ncbi:hypothetical protein [Membranihabitans maritimus]|uniref:hypothetical protein n=1 Tax=Membranihabitans maritimus TaxID=2904244 RepID=UPI001F2C0D9A|nr:hypothetical protein [Membranihabitans maritimus]
MIRYIYIAVVFFTSVQCSSWFYNAERQSGEKQPAELKLEPDYDLYELRIDLYRKEKSANSAQETREEEDYNPLGFFLGEGLFYDLNGNLSFDVIRLLGIDRFSNFEIMQNTPNMFGAMQEKYFTKRGSEFFKSNQKGSKSVFGSNRIIKRNGQNIEVQDGPLNKFTIEKNNDKLALKNFLSNRTIEKIGPSRYRIGGFLVDENIEEREGIIVLDDDFRLKKEGKDIIIEQNQFWSFSEVWRISRTEENILYIYRRDRLIMKIFHFDNSVVMEQNGRVKVEYNLL